MASVPAALRVAPYLLHLYSFWFLREVQKPCKLECFWAFRRPKLIVFEGFACKRRLWWCLQRVRRTRAKPSVMFADGRAPRSQTAVGF